METLTNKLSAFGSRERAMLVDLLTAWEKQGLPEDFIEQDVEAMFNLNSGNVFLTNSDYQLAMMNGEKLESFYTCPSCGHEGFLDEMKHKGDKNCKDYLKQIKEVA